MGKGLKHIHTWERWKTFPKGGVYFRCTHPLCTTTAPASLLLGKACKCHKCSGDFVLTKEDLRRKNPACLNCSNTKEARELRSKNEILKIAGLSPESTLKDEPFF